MTSVLDGLLLLLIHRRFYNMYILFDAYKPVPKCPSVFGKFTEYLL